MYKKFREERNVFKTIVNTTVNFLRTIKKTFKFVIKPSRSKLLCKL